MAIDSYSSSRAKQQKAFDDYFGGGRSGLSNRPISKGTTISTREKPEKSGIMSSLASAIERGKQTRLRNEARRFGKAGKPNLPRTISDPIVSEFQLANMIDAGYEPARRNLFGNIVNPYGSTGLKQYISFPNLEQNQRNEILNKRVQRFMNPQTDDPSLRRGFGSLFGSSEGEPTISGPLRKQIEPMSPIEMGARGIFLFFLAIFLDRLCLWLTQEEQQWFQNLVPITTLTKILVIILKAWLEVCLTFYRGRRNRGT